MSSYELLLDVGQKFYCLVLIRRNPLSHLTMTLLLILSRGSETECYWHGGCTALSFVSFCFLWRNENDHHTDCHTDTMDLSHRSLSPIFASPRDRLRSLLVHNYVAITSSAPSDSVSWSTTPWSVVRPATAAFHHISTCRLHSRSFKVVRSRGFY